MNCRHFCRKNMSSSGCISAKLVHKLASSAQIPMGRLSRRQNQALQRGAWTEDKRQQA